MSENDLSVIVDSLPKKIDYKRSGDRYNLLILKDDHDFLKIGYFRVIKYGYSMIKPLIIVEHGSLQEGIAKLKEKIHEYYNLITKHGTTFDYFKYKKENP